MSQGAKQRIKAAKDKVKPNKVKWPKDKDRSKKEK